MNSKIIVSCLMLLPFSSVATDNAEPFYALGQAKAITYKITIYRNDSYDEKTWAKLVTGATTAIERASEFEHDGNAATNEIVDAFVGAVQEIYALNDDQSKGIHGQMSIEVADNFEDDMAATDLDQE